jgi:tetratricopeptide (TPR) repeat protein
MEPMQPDGRAAPGRRATGRALAAILLVAILLVGALLRGLYLAEIADSPETVAPSLDAAFHDHWAKALVTGDWSPPRFFPDPQIHTTPYFRPPGYPFFLAAIYAVTGQSALPARGVQMLLGLVNVWLAYRLGRALFDRAVGLLAAAGLACTWSLLYFEGELLEPVLVVTLVLGSSLVWLRWWHRGGWLLALGGGLLLGGFALVRPNALALVPVVWLWALWTLRRRRLPGRMRSVLLGLPIGVLVAVAPATIRNLVVADDFVLITSNGGVNLFIGNNAEADGYTARIPILHDLAAVQGWTCFDQPAIVRGVERLEGRHLRASEVSDFFARKAVDFATAHPGATLALAAKKAALFWGPLEVANNRELELVRANSPVLRWLPTFPWVLSLALIGALRLVGDLRRTARDHRFDMVVLLAGIVLVWFASHLPFFVAGRYRTALVPLLWVFAAYAVRSVVGLLPARRPRAIAWAAAWLALLVCLHVPLVDYRPDAGRWHFQRADAWRMCGDLDAAIAEFRAAIAVARATDPLPHNNLGGALLQRGEATEATACFQKALAIDPAYVAARFNLALAFANRGRDDLARTELEEVVRRDPDGAAARIQLGAILMRLGLPAEALGHLEAVVRQGNAAADVRYLCALALLDTGRVDDGRALLAGIARTEPRFADACVVLAELAVQQGERDRAVALLQQALAVDPRHADAAAMLTRLR